MNRSDRLAQLEANLWKMRSAIGRDRARESRARKQEIRANIRALYPKSCPDIRAYFVDVLASL